MLIVSVILFLLTLLIFILKRPLLPDSHWIPNSLILVVNDFVVLLSSMGVS